MKKITLKKNDPIRFVLFRTDRIGDVVLTLQCVEALKVTYPNSSICFVMRSYTAPLLKNNPFIDEVILSDSMDEKSLTKLIRSKKFDVSIAFFASKIACKATFFARIPIRIGPFSKLRALLFTHRITQKRSLGEKNEAEYNLDLLLPLGIKDKFFPKIYIDQDEKNQAQNYLQHKFPHYEKLIIIHPGSGGSSKDWSVPNYLSLANLIKQNNIAEVLITGSQEELDRYQSMLKDYVFLNSHNLLETSKPLREFLAILQESKLFLSNSTGPLHCAVALDVPTIAFYPLMQSCKPARWGPFSKNMQIHSVITPATREGSPLPECVSCSQKCPYYLCMDLIEVKSIYKLITAKYFPDSKNSKELF